MSEHIHQTYNAVNQLWLARDMGGSGLYTLWINSEPEINHDGYYKYSVTNNCMSLLLVTIHPSKLPWATLTLDRGDCILLELNKVAGKVEQVIAEIPNKP